MANIVFPNDLNSAPLCTVCEHKVVDDGTRSITKLICGHYFHVGKYLFIYIFFIRIFLYKQMINRLVDLSLLNTKVVYLMYMTFLIIFCLDLLLIKLDIYFVFSYIHLR